MFFFLKQKLSGIAVPNWLGQILDYFKNEVRSFLEPKEFIKCMWINTKGLKDHI